MKRTALIVYFILLNTVLSAQFKSECFENVRDEMKKEMLLAAEKTKKDSTVFVINMLPKLVGCRYPYFPLQTYDKKEINPINLKADYIIINYNYSYCDHCMKQLDELVKLKQDSKKDIKVIAVFNESTNGLDHILEKYKDQILISPNGEKWANEFSFGMGQPMSYVLDKNKIVVFVDPINFSDTDSFTKMLEKIK